MSDTDHTSDPTSELRELLGDGYVATVRAAAEGMKPGGLQSAIDVGGKVGQVAYLALIDQAVRALGVLVPRLRTAEARATAAEVTSRGYRERAEKAEAERELAERAEKAEAERDALAERAEAAEAKAARFAGLLGHQSRTLTDTIAAETIRQKADAWDEGYTSGHSRAMRRMSDEPNVEPGTNPYRAATPPTTTTTEETTHE